MSNYLWQISTEKPAIVFKIGTPSEFQVKLPVVQPGIISYSLVNTLTSRLGQVFEECKERNWDDEGADPVDVPTFLNAEKVVSSLPQSISVPNVFAQSSGKISFQWMRGSRDAVMVSVDGTGKMTYAVVTEEGAKQHGSEAFWGALPRFLSERLVQIFPERCSQTAAASA